MKGFVINMRAMLFNWSGVGWKGWGREKKCYTCIHFPLFLKLICIKLSKLNLYPLFCKSTQDVFIAFDSIFLQSSYFERDLFLFDQVNLMQPMATKKGYYLVNLTCMTCKLQNTFKGLKDRLICLYCNCMERKGDLFDYILLALLLNSLIQKKKKKVWSKKLRVCDWAKFFVPLNDGHFWSCLKK